jgi:hypothetical protein
LQKFPADSRISGNLDAETGSNPTASATTHFFELADFPETAKWPAIGELRRWRFVSAETNSSKAGFWASCLCGPNSPFPAVASENEDRIGDVDLETEHLPLSRPLRGQVAHPRLKNKQRITESWQLNARVFRGRR